MSEEAVVTENTEVTPQASSGKTLSPEESIARLYAESKHNQERYKAVRTERDSLKSELDKSLSASAQWASEREALVKELDTLKREPNAIREELEQYKSKERTAKHKEAFKKVAESLNVKPEAVDDLYRLVEYKADTDEPDEEHITGLVGEKVKDRPYLLTGEVAAPSFPAPGHSRGSSTTGSSGFTFTVRESELPSISSSPNAAKYLEAFKNKTLKIVKG